MSYFEFPHTRTYDSDLGWLIKKLGELIQEYGTIAAWKAQHELEYLDLENKVEGLINSLVDVIVPWDSSIAYHIFSIVEYQGTNYIAIQDVPVGTMITNTDYWQPADTTVEQINAIGLTVSEIESKIIAYRTPEQYGAAGDGLTDDTAAFQAMLADTNCSSFKLRYGKTYIVNELEITREKLYIDGNGATIKASRTCDYVIKFSNTTNEYNGTLCNITIDGNGQAQTLIYLDHCIRMNFTNIALFDADPDGGKAIYTTGACGGTTFSIIKGRMHSNPNTAWFIYNTGADINYSFLDYHNFLIGFYNTTNTRITEFHGFITAVPEAAETYTMYTDSKFMHLNGGRCSVVHAYPDTQQYWYYVTAPGDYVINGGESFHSTLIPDAIIEATPAGHSYCVYATATGNVRRFRLVNQSLKVHDSITKVLFCNDNNAAFDVSGTTCTIAAMEFNTWKHATKNGIVNLVAASANVVKHCVGQMDDLGNVYINGYLEITDAFTGSNEIDLLSINTTLYDFDMINTGLAAAPVLVGNSPHSAVPGDAKVFYNDNKIRLYKLSATDLSNKRLYLPYNMIKIKCIA